VGGYTLRLLYFRKGAHGTSNLGDWVGSLVGLDLVPKRKNPFTALARNWTLVIQPIA